MVTFIKKIKTKEGINSFNLDKIRKDIPADFQVLDEQPAITYTANHIVVAYKVKLITLTKEAIVKKKAPARKKAVVVVKA